MQKLELQFIKYAVYQEMFRECFKWKENGDRIGIQIYNFVFYFTSRACKEIFRKNVKNDEK